MLEKSYMNDYYCGGAFGRNYDIDGAEVIAEGTTWLVVQCSNGTVRFASFESEYEKDAFDENYKSYSTNNDEKILNR